MSEHPRRTENPRRTLVTNDDGIDSPGLLALARAAHAVGLDVVVVAPLIEASGTSAGLSAVERDGRVLVERRELPELDVPAYAVAAHPGFIVLISAQGTFGPPPEVVLSGVNRGANVGRAVLHSGTLGGALTGATHDARAMAVSLDVGLGRPDDATEHWTSACEVARMLLPGVLAAPPDAAYNVNVPNLPAEQLGPVRAATLARFGAVRSRVDQSTPGHLRVSTTIVDGEADPGTDMALLSAGHPTVTAVRLVGTAPELTGVDPSAVFRRAGRD